MFSVDVVVVQWQDWDPDKEWDGSQDVGPGGRSVSGRTGQQSISF